MDESTTTDPSPTVVPQVKPRRRRVWGWLVFLVVAALAGGAIYWYLYRPVVDDQATTTVSTTPVAETATTAAATSTPVVERITDPGITWLTDRAVFTDPGLTVHEADLDLNNVTPPAYYTVGKSSDGGTLVMLEVNPDSPAGIVYVLLKKTAAGQWLRYDRYSDSLEGYPYSLDYKQVTDSNAAIPSLDIPTRLTVNKTTLLTQTMYVYSSFAKSGTDTSTMKKIADTPYGTLYAVGEVNKTGTDADALVGKALKIARNDGRYTQVKVELPFLRDDKTVSITTPDGKGVKGAFADEGQGCGRVATTTYVADETALNGKVAVGTSSDGSTVYTLNAADNPILKTYYEQYSSTRTYEGSTEKVVSFETYRQGTPVLLWQDGFGQWIVLQNDAYAMLAECGKPVVYLYPEKETPVTVKVGAAITKSEPTYGTGWTGIAKPDSQIVVNGVTYPYLFWEGHGEGMYPDTSAMGTVVPQRDVRATLNRQLNELGLTAREQADFKEFWVPLLPTDPYVRLTWLTTAAMNQIAPLTITPKPDTLIRVFLDFAGMQIPTVVRPQALHAVPRVGFTAVEWGGLLH